MTEAHQCVRCEEFKPRSAFYRQKDKKSGLHSWCKECMRAREAERLQESPELRERQRSYGQTQKARRYRKDWKLRKRYGLGLEEYETLVVEQGGRCAICGATEENLVVDHCHDSGTLRALLCGPCNKGLGHFRDDVGLLEAAVSYLRRHRGV